MYKRPLVLLLSALLLTFSITGCKHLKNKKNKLTHNPALYTSEIYSDCPIDSAYVKGEVERDPSLVPYADDILDFYQRRNYESAWLDHDTLTLGAYDLLSLLRTYETQFGDSSVMIGLDDAGIGAMLISGSPGSRSVLDLKLTATFFKYASHAYGSDVDPKDLEWFIPHHKVDYQRLIDSLVTAPSLLSVYEPVNAYYRSLKKVLVEYRRIEKSGGLPYVSARTPLRRGSSDDAIIKLKQSLAITGDYTEADRSALYTDTFATAVSHYQHRVGLRETGTIDSLTLAEINVPITHRIRQVIINMERLRWMPDSLPSRYILVNIPEYRLHFYEGTADSLSMDVVVGRAANATSIFTGKLSVVSFSPYWNIPQSIIRKEMLPILKRNPGYLPAHHMEVLKNGVIISPYSVNWSQYTKGVPFDIRQRPGDDCALGLVAFFFPNSYDIYLHDTPAKSFFNETDRAFSHGCIRLANAEKLADYIFKSDTTMPPDRIRQLMDAHVNKKVPVKPSIPVYVVYFTAWVDETGTVNFRHDIYGHDRKLAKEIFGKQSVIN
jgi:murein L,D-transpeptidase YcbB/YkuD